MDGAALVGAQRGYERAWRGNRNCDDLRGINFLNSPHKLLSVLFKMS
jgi:hypothetical protein